MSTVDISTENLIIKGDMFRGTYTTTLDIGTKVLDNGLTGRERTTFYCKSSQDGSWRIFDVDEKAQTSLVKTVAVTGGRLYIENFDMVFFRAYCEFSPTAAPGVETLVIRGYPSAYGARS